MIPDGEDVVVCQSVQSVQGSGELAVEFSLQIDGAGTEHVSCSGTLSVVAYLLDGTGIDA